jgi:tRNA nucleotidyltransferase (CCA-adding enzyme)
MKKMVQEGEVNALIAERVWKEFEKAMSEIAPWRFIEVLSDCDALPILFSIFNTKKIEVIACLKKISELTENCFERIVLLMQSTQSLVEVENLCKHYRAPNPIIEMARLLMKFEPVETAKQLLNLFIQLDAFRRENRFKQWLKIGEIQTFSTNYAAFLLSAFNRIHNIKIPSDFLVNNNGKMIGEYIYQQRLKELSQGEF